MERSRRDYGVIFTSLFDSGKSVWDTECGWNALWRCLTDQRIAKIYLGAELRRLEIGRNRKKKKKAATA